MNIVFPFGVNFLKVFYFIYRFISYFYNWEEFDINLDQLRDI